MNTLWVTGAAGIVGSKLVKEAAKLGRFERICAFTHKHSTGYAPFSNVIWSIIDIGDRETIQSEARINPPNIIINCAAMTNVDACELSRNEAQRVNSEGVSYLAEVSYQYGAHMIQISTDYIFSGDAAHPGPYEEDRKPHPINFYGQTKLDGEYMVLELCEGRVPYTIVRTAQVYSLASHQRLDFVTWLIGKLTAKQRVRVAYDQWSTPTHVDDVAACLLWIAEHEKTGIYHVAGPNFISRQEWAYIIVRRFGFGTELIDWVASPELGQVAERPRLCGLLCQRLKEDFTEGAPRPRNIVKGLLDIGKDDR